MQPHEWRDVANNNRLVVLFTVLSDTLFLPRLLVEAGFFESTSQVKKNRPDLWITLLPGTMTNIEIGKWAEITIHTT